MITWDLILTLQRSLMLCSEACLASRKTIYVDLIERIRVVILLENSIHLPEINIRDCVLR